MPYHRSMMNSHRSTILRRCVRIVICLTVAALLSASASAEQIKISGSTMGTYYSVIIDGPEEASAEAIRSKIESTLEDVNRQMSTWDPQSEISLFNEQQSTDWVAVSAEFAGVVQEAKRVHRMTEGAFEPTLAPLIDLWGFGDHRPKSPPTQKAIDEARVHVGLDQIEVRIAPPALKKSDPLLQLNLSAIAKGHGVDRVSEVLAENGWDAHVVDIGGENRAGKAKADGSGWRLGIESPSGGLLEILEVTETCIATSGDYRNFFEIDGVRYSHAIDPRTGRPVRNPPASVSVLHPSCMTADALATALMVMGVADGIAMADANNLSALFQIIEPDGSVTEHRTGEFQKSQKAAESGVWWVPFVAAAALFLLAIIGMAIGVLVRNRELKGSCGGLSAMAGAEGQSVCDLCSVPKDECVNAEVREKLAAQAESLQGVE